MYECTYTKYMGEKQVLARRKKCCTALTDRPTVKSQYVADALFPTSPPCLFAAACVILYRSLDENCTDRDLYLIRMKADFPVIPPAGQGGPDSDEALYYPRGPAAADKNWPVNEFH